MTASWPAHDPSELEAAKAAEIVVTAQAADVGEARKSRYATDAHEETAETDSFISWATANEVVPGLVELEVAVPRLTPAMR